MKNLKFLVFLLVGSSLFFTSCAKEEIIEDAFIVDSEEVITVEIPRGLSEVEAQEWLDALTYDEAVSLSVETVVGSRWCGGWSFWQTYSSSASCYGCSGYAKARHTLYQRRSRVCCNSSYCYGQTQYRTSYACRTYC